MDCSRLHATLLRIDCYRPDHNSVYMAAYVGSDQSTCSVAGAPPSFEYISRKRKRSLGGGGCRYHSQYTVLADPVEYRMNVKTYPRNTGNPHHLPCLLPALKLTAADSLQLQLLRPRHRGLQIDCAKA